jgi:uncharacterized protein YndB with AHSA1/START domain
MSEYGVVVEQGTVRFERVLPGPIERVWEYLTDSKLRGTWFASGPMELRVGGRVHLRFQHSNLSPHAEKTPEKYKAMDTPQGITLTGTITVCVPPRRLAFTWDESEVILDLAPAGGDVRLVLTHRRLPSRAEMINVSGGWHTHLDVLEERLRGQVPKPFWPRIEPLEREYEARIPV